MKTLSQSQKIQEGDEMMKLLEDAMFHLEMCQESFSPRQEELMGKYLELLARLKS